MTIRVNKIPTPGDLRKFRQESETIGTDIQPSSNKWYRKDGSP